MDDVERVARAMAESEGHKWLPWFAEQYGDDYRSSARAIIPIIAADAVGRERAKVVAWLRDRRDDEGRTYSDAEFYADAIAANAHTGGNPPEPPS